MKSRAARYLVKTKGRWSYFQRPSSNLAPQVGLEPTTLRLTAECSAIELLRNIERAMFGRTCANHSYNKASQSGSRRPAPRATVVQTRKCCSMRASISNYSKQRKG